MSIASYSSEFTSADTQTMLPAAPHSASVLILRAEGALAFATATLAYGLIGQGWLLFALLFFTPDVFMLGYLRNKTLGAVLYNLGHSYLTPAALFVAANVLVSPVWAGVALIWIAHIGFDRAAGYGLKRATSFHHTHLSI